MPESLVPDKQFVECFVSEVKIRGLWGYRDLDLPFSREANILIGRNATGKTSVINLMRFLLTLDIPSLLDITFRELELVLKSYEGSESYRLNALVKEPFLTISLDGKMEYQIELPPGVLLSTSRREIELRDADRVMNRRRLGRYATSGQLELREKLRLMVPSVWLPVNRGLGTRDEPSYRSDREDGENTGTVEQRLEALLGELKTYRLALEARLSAKYKEFERRVLSLILFNKDYDNLASFKWESNSTSTEEDRTQLVTAFKEAGLIDHDMLERIDKHFMAQGEAVQRIRMQAGKGTFNVDDIFIVPLIRRTKEMIEFARGIEASKQEIFLALNRYSQIVSDFLHDKGVTVSEKGHLIIDYDIRVIRGQKFCGFEETRISRIRTN